MARKTQKLAAPLVKVSEDNNGKTQIVPDPSEPAVAVALLMEAFATTDPCFVAILLNQLSYAGSHGRRLMLVSELAMILSNLSPTIGAAAKR